MDKSLTLDQKQSHFRTSVIIILIIIAWFLAYNLIQPLANWITYDLFTFIKGTHLGDAVAFFLYDVPPMLLHLPGMIFIISTIRTFFSPERHRALLGVERQGIGNLLAALLGIVTPFCSCSAVPFYRYR
jgi:uncharacterized protein